MSYKSFKEFLKKINKRILLKNMRLDLIVKIDSLIKSFLRIIKTSFKWY
jgi:hypothetical protein